jgi:hypothetical protein
MLQALGRVLRPLVRLLIRSGVTFPILADLLRTIYVEVASTDLAHGERPRTDSRIALLTGIHRKELRRQRTAVPEAEPTVITLNSQIIGRWLGDPAYTGPDGKPAALPRTGPAPSFDALVATVTRDVRARSVLDEWLARGMAVLDADGHVALQVAAFLPREDTASRLFYFARNLQDHIAAAAANVLTTDKPPFLERSVHYDGLSAEAAASLERIARETAKNALLDVNRAALAIADADDAASGDTPRAHRVNFGIFVYPEDAGNAG